MNDHPNELLLEAYVDGTATAEERRVVLDHIERCEDCAGYVQRVASLTESLRALPTTARRIPPIARWRSISPLVAAAAAAVIFTAGVAVGTATRGGPEASLPAPPDLRPALDVQQAGTSYIAALARLNATDGSTVYGREVALATLYGAAAEAVAPLGTDAEASKLLELARTVRDRAAQSSPTERTQ